MFVQLLFFTISNDFFHFLSRFQFCHSKYAISNLLVISLESFTLINHQLSLNNSLVQPTFVIIIGKLLANASNNVLLIHSFSLARTYISLLLYSFASSLCSFFH
ncbi:MAG: hypothetical protein Q8M44_04405 [bacterium]|nr:hypothetical protein [bacterium]